jgi:hypothetical protein
MHHLAGAVDPEPLDDAAATARISARRSRKGSRERVNHRRADGLPAAAAAAMAGRAAQSLAGLDPELADPGARTRRRRRPVPRRRPA